MKNEKIFSSRWSLGFLVFASLIFSACGDAAKSVDQTAANTTASNEPVYTTANAASNSMAGAPSMEKAESMADSGDVTIGERYAEITENPFLESSRAPLSTFSIDVDTASYANVRRYLNNGQLPPKDAVRIEEMLNYFPQHNKLNIRINELRPGRRPQLFLF